MTPGLQSPVTRASAASIIEGEIREGRLALPMLPNVAAEVMASSIDRQADAAKLAALIQRDQSLASNVLRMANSPALRATTTIVSLQQAIARLGMLRIREIAVSVAFKGALLRGGPYEARTDAIWRGSLAAGLWAREIARVARKSVEVAYLCGLLHGIGAPVVLHRLGELDAGLQPSAVDDLLATLAPIAGVRLAEAWSLPEPIAATIRYLHDPKQAGANADLVAAASLGSVLGQWSDSDEESIEPLLGLPATTWLNLYPDDVEALLAHRTEIAESLAAMIL